MKFSTYKTVIIGSGAAGLFAAINIASRSDFDGKILVITKCPFGESNSRYAQGGIAAAIKNNSEDSVELHIKDTLKSGAGLCNEEVVNFIVKNAETAINELAAINAGFDKDKSGNFEFALGGAHSTKRVLHSGEDATGMVMIKALCEKVKSSKIIDIKEKTMAVELIISEEKECEGVVVFNNSTKEHEIILSPNIIIASGGAGQLYKYTTNPYGATGDGYVLAYQAGATLQDLEFVQFHPTALVLNSESKNRYLISEAIRGEGAKLVNNNGEEFMSNYSKHKELAQRDIVARAIMSEMEKEGKPNVFLKTSDIKPEIILKRFPSIAKKCLTNGIDITKSPIPVAPAAHYMIGGIQASQDGKTSIKGLYAIGEVTSTGFHGANRLASNSLLECVVCAGALAKNIDFKQKEKNYKNDNIIKNLITKYETTNNDAANYQSLKDKLKEIMWEKVGIIRSESSLIEALKEIETLKQNLKTGCFSSISAYEYKNMLILSELITKCALERKESRGAHYRNDYPYAEQNLKHSFVQKQ